MSGSPWIMLILRSFSFFPLLGVINKENIKLFGKSFKEKSIICCHEDIMCFNYRKMFICFSKSTRRQRDEKIFWSFWLWWKYIWVSHIIIHHKVLLRVLIWCIECRVILNAFILMDNLAILFWIVPGRYEVN